MKMIVAVDENWGIGKNGDLLCHLPGDLKYFKEQTLGKTVVMGRRTLESLPGGRGLPGRGNIVLTRNPYYVPEDEEVDVAHDAGALAMLLTMLGNDAIIIGGASLYEFYLDYTVEVLVTKIRASFDADVFFPNLDEDPHFTMVWESEPMEEIGITYTFTRDVRVPEERDA